MFSKMGNYAVKYRFWIIAIWIILALVSYLFAPSLSKVGTMTESNFLPRDSESLRARELIKEYFPESTSVSSATLVFYNAEGLNDTDMTYARQVRDWLLSGKTPFDVENVTSVFDNAQLESQLISPDKTTMLLNVGMAKSAFESDSGSTTQAIRDYVVSSPQELQIYVSGQVGVYSDLFDSLNKSITLTTIMTIILLVVLLVIIYRSPIALMVPLLTIGVAYLVSRGVMGLIARAGVAIWSQIDIFLIVIIFGIGTDYCLFLVSRFREELGRQPSRIEAMTFTVGRIGAVITASALAVVVGLAGMAVARYQMIQTMGPVLGLAILITLLASLSLTPALASVFGKKLFWPLHEKVGKSTTTKTGFWTRVATFATGKPVIIIGIVLIIMLLPFFQLPQVKRSFNQIAEIPSGAESVAGYNVLLQHFDIGEMEPLNVVIVGQQGEKLTSPASLAAISQISNDLLGIKGIVKVQSAVLPEGSGQSPAGLTVSGQLTSISEGISTAFSSSNTDPEALFGSTVNDSIILLNGYLNELSASFTWVNDNKSYQGVVADLQSIEQTINTVKSGALVENQLQALSSQVGHFGQSLASGDGTIPPGADQSIGLISNYLDELAAAYPVIKTETSFQTVSTRLSAIQSALTNIQTIPPEMLPTLQTQLKSSIQEIAGGLSELASTFTGSNSMLLSTVLAQASQDESPITILQSQFNMFITNIKVLGNDFVQNGNPYFLSTTLSASSTDLQNLSKLFFSQDYQAARMYIVLDAYPQSDAAFTLVKQARTTIQQSIQKTALQESQIVIGGTSAEMTDVQQVLNQDFGRVLFVVLAAIFLVLSVLLRSLIAPIYLLLTVALSYGTTLGIVGWIFQGLLGQDGISFMIPIIVFVLLVALGSDYNIFLMSRVREESEKQPTRIGARLAAIATGGVITACGIILAGTFATLSFGPIRTMVQVGAAVAIGVFIDTFLVRALLVPAIASLLGRWNWWPSKHG